MTEISKVYPPHISFTNPLSILSRQNLKIGWALLWRGVIVPYGLLYGIVKVFPDLETIIGKDLFGFSAFCLMVFSLAYFARKVALKEYGVVLSGILWPFLWRILIALYSIVLFSVFELAAMGQAGSLVGAVVTLLGAGLMLLGAAGWAFHRQMEIPTATNSRQVVGIIFATVVFAWIIYLNHDREGGDIRGYTAKESNLVDTKRDSRESSNQATNISKRKIVDFEQDKALKFGWNTPCIVYFYADWCGACKELDPVMTELAEKYTGKLNVYRVNAEMDKQCRSICGIESVPTMLFIPASGPAKTILGFQYKETLEDAIVDVLDIK